MSTDDISLPTVGEIVLVESKAKIPWIADHDFAHVCLKAKDELSRLAEQLFQSGEQPETKVCAAP